MVDGLQGFPAGFSDQFKRTVNQLNASFTFALSNGLELGVWGRNLTNARYLSTIFPAVAQAGSVSGYPSQPRTYGVTGRFTFLWERAGRHRRSAAPRTHNNPRPPPHRPGLSFWPSLLSNAHTHHPPPCPNPSL